MLKVNYWNKKCNKNRRKG